MVFFRCDAVYNGIQAPSASQEPVTFIFRVGDLNMKFYHNADTYLYGVTIFITLVIINTNNYMLKLNL